MAWQYTPYTAPVFLSSLVGGLVGLIAVRYRDRPGAAPLAVFMFGASCWSFAEGMSLAHAGTGMTIFWSRVAMTVSVVVPIAWLALTLEYTGNGHLLEWRTFAVLSIEPVLFVGTLAVRPELFRRVTGTRTVDGFRLLETEFGPMLHVHAIYSYLLLFLGAGLLVKVILSTEGVYRSQSTALLAAIFVPFVGNVLYVLEVVPEGVHLTSVGFLFTGVIVAATVLRRQLLDFVPVAREVARDELIENMDDKVIVLDGSDRVADCNPAAAALLGRSKREAIGQPIAELLPEIEALLPAAGPVRTQAEFATDDHAGVRSYDVRITPLTRARGVVTGRLVSLRDVTERRQQRQRLNVLNRLLRHNLRNEMNVIVSNAELVERDLSDPELVERLDRIADKATDITHQSDKIGRVARLLEEETASTVDLAAVVRDELAHAHDMYPEATFELRLPDSLPVEVGHSIAIAVSELIDNAVEHGGEKPVVSITARRTERYAVLEIGDDGPGIEPHELAVLDEGEETALRHGSGVGLWVVHWIIRQFEGRLEFENDDGCTVTVWLPRPADEIGSAPDGARGASEDDEGGDSAGPETGQGDRPSR